MIACIYFKHHFHAWAEPMSGGALEVWTEQRPRVLPAFGLCACYRSVAGTVFFHEFHVAVASRFSCFRQFRLYPILVRHARFDGRTQYGVQFEQCHRSSVSDTVMCHQVCCLCVIAVANRLFPCRKPDRNQVCRSRICCRDDRCCRPNGVQDPLFLLPSCPAKPATGRP